MITTGSEISEQYQVPGTTSTTGVMKSMIHSSPLRRKARRRLSPVIVAQTLLVLLAVSPDGRVLSASPSLYATGPHLPLASPNCDPREQFCAKLLDRLWLNYKQQVPYVGIYESIATSGPFVNDHIAFRSLASGKTGIMALSRVFEALGYQIAGVYQFPSKSLTALHLEYPNNPNFPKLFLSELRVWEMPHHIQTILQDHLESGVGSSVSNDVLARIAHLNRGSSLNDEDELLNQCHLLDQLVAFFETLPWKIPTRKSLQTVNQYSPYAAWVLVHGYKVNHFTGLVMDLETLVDVLKKSGVPMKATIEGAAHSKLRQTATLAVLANVTVLDDNGTPTKTPWTYAYLEFCERPAIVDRNGVKSRFEGFLGEQATELFEMTNTRSDDDETL